MYLPETLSEIKKFRPAALRTGKEWFVEYYVYNPIDRIMVRKKIKLNHIRKASERREYAIGLIRRLNQELERGWNPFIKDQNSKSYSLLTKAIDEFLRINKKRYAEGDLRQMTVAAYISKMKVLNEYIEENKLQNAYVYHFNREFITRFLDYVYTDRNNRSRTRDNYLKTIRLFCNFLVERNYLKVSPAESIAIMGKGKRGARLREVIPAEIRKRISDYLISTNKHYLLACELIYFCMIRPRELSFVRIEYINPGNGTIFIPGSISKNQKDAVLTMPPALTSLISELGITAYPKDFYLFSTGFIPGKSYSKDKHFRDYWRKTVRPALNLPASIQLYSLKDTGITDMIRKHGDPIIARDQARHYDLSITNIYTPPETTRANPTIRNDDREF